MINLAHKNLYILAIVVNVLVVMLVIVFQSKLPPLVPLLYGLPIGKEQLVDKSLLAIPCLVSLVLISADAYVSIRTKNLFVEHVLAGIAIAITLLASITTIKIFFLVGASF